MELCVLLVLALHSSVHIVTAEENDYFERLIPKFMPRFQEIQEILLPLPKETIQEALYNLGSYLIPIDSETEECRNHSSVQFQAFLDKEIWALRMVDAASKLPAGMLDGHFIQIGIFDQCLTTREPGGKFKGKHCIVETKGLTPDVIEAFNPERTFLPMIRMDIAFAVCVPSSCTPNDVKVHMDVALNSVNATAIVHEKSCTTTDTEPFSASDWFAILVILVISLLVIFSTWYDNNCIESEKNKLLTSFSISSNIPRMLDTKTTAAALTCLNGLRVFAMAWVMLGHRMLYMLSWPNIRFRTIAERIDEFALAPIENTQLAVEIFFLMSGILVCYGYLRYRLKAKKFNLAQFYLFRYFRLTPTLAMAVLLHATLYVRVNDGPLWNRSVSYLQEACQKWWWTNLLYINNYVNPYQISWYLASDFQLYVLSPLLLIPLHRKPKLGFLLIAVLLVLTTGGGLWNALAQDLRAGGAVTIWCFIGNAPKSNCDRRTEINQIKDYIVTHVRAASFLMGVALGYLLFKIKEGQVIIKLSRPTLWAGWLTSIFLILFSVFFVVHFQNPDYVYSPVIDTLYHVLHRHILTLGFCWIILACTLGYGGFLDKLLSWPVLIPLARLTYCAYLIHVAMQGIHSFSQRTNGYISLTILYYHFFGDFFISYLAAAVLYLTVEAPSANIMSYFFEGKKEKKSEEEPPQGTQLPVYKYNQNSNT